MKNLAHHNDNPEIVPELIGTTLCAMMAGVRKKSAGEPQDKNRIPTGFPDLDSITGGLPPGSTNVIAARPSMGREILAFNIASHVALAESLPMVIFSMEKSCVGVTTMLASQRAKIDLSSLRSQVLPESEFSRLQTAVAQIQEAKIYIDDSPELSANEIYNRVQRIHARHDRLGLVVIDSLQLMYAGTGDKASGYRAIMRSLKCLAKGFRVPVIVLSELDCKLENRKNMRPLLSDLPAATIWKQADMVLFIYRGEVYKPESQDRGKAEIIIGRNRNGPVGVVQLGFEGQFAGFVGRA